MTRLKVPEVISAFGSIGHMLEESQRDGDVCLRDGALKCQRHGSGRKYGAVDLQIVLLILGLGLLQTYTLEVEDQTKNCYFCIVDAKLTNSYYHGAKYRRWTSRHI